MGIKIINLPDGRVQLLHTMAHAKSTEDGEEGLLFMQEMIELSKQQNNLPVTEAKAVKYSLMETRRSFMPGQPSSGEL